MRWNTPANMNRTPQGMESVDKPSLTLENKLPNQDVTARVREMYRRHPFPTPQRKNTYQHHAKYVRQFLEELGVDPAGKRFGDMASGTGLMMLDYCREFPQTAFIGYDLSDVSVAHANDTLQQEGATNGRCHVRDIMELDIDGEFNYVLSWGTMHHLSDPRTGIQKLCRAVKPGGVLRTGVYGWYGNWERRIQQEIVRVVSQNLDPGDFGARIPIVQEWASGDRNFKNYYTAPPVELDDGDWVVDEFLHVWEQHLKLRDVVSWLSAEGMEILRLTDYYDQEIPLDITRHSTSQPFIDRVRGLSFEDQCHVIDMIARPYWLSLFARKL